MQRLILDFIRRRWWLLALLIVLSAGFMAAGIPLIVTPFALVALLFDAQRGLLRTVRPLPVTRRAQAGTWWFIGVLLVPLITLAAYPVSALIYQATHPSHMLPIPAVNGSSFPSFPPGPNQIDPWFMAAVSTWVGLGYAGFCFLLCVALPTRPASRPLETIWQSIIGALWGLSMSAPMLFMFILPKNPGAVTPWHWVLFAAVPVLVLASLVAAPDMAERRMFTVTGTRIPPADPADREHGGLTGPTLLLSSLMGRTLILLILVVAGQLLITEFTGRSAHANNPANFTQIVAFTVLFGAFSVESAGLRMLRMLPLSTARLTLLLLATPTILGLICGGFMTLVNGLDYPLAALLTGLFARSAVIAGAGGLALTTSLHINSGVRFLVLIIVAALASFAVLYVPQFPIAILVGGSVSLPLSYILLQRGLRKSSVFYQQRRIFGINPGQPLAMR